MSLLDELVGLQLSAVTFVMDYVQLAFDGPVLSAYTWPVVINAGRSFRWGDPGYRDQLCSRIAHEARSATVDAQHISLQFDDDVTVVVSLLPEDLRGAESAMFQGKNKLWGVFRPGE